MSINRDDYWFTYRESRFAGAQIMHAVKVVDTDRFKGLCGVSGSFAFSDAKDDAPTMTPTCRRCRKAWLKLIESSDP